MTPGDVKPLRVKVYGLFSMTKRTYVIIQVIGLCLVTAMMAVGLGAMLLAGQWLPRFTPPPAPVPADWSLLQGLIVLFWVGLVTLLLEGIETFVVLQKFAHAEARGRPGPASPDAAPAPTPPITDTQP